jgi:hypothetical protein
MTLQRFQCLSQQAQQDTVRYVGVFLCERRSLDMTVFLYGVADFYTEVYFVRSGKPVLIRSFADTDLLLPYLSQIELAGLPEGVHCVHT